MLRAADGWIALTLARTADFEVLPALAAGEIVTGGWDVAADDGVTECVWEGLEVFASGRASLEVVSAAQLLGLPAARVSAPGVGSLPWSVERLGETVAPGPRRFRVVDLSAMWAGPLCAHLLGRAGAEVTKVEDAGRPDAARAGDPWLFAQLHRGHEQAVLDFGSATGRRALTELVAGADVVVEASRPRALGHLGFSPEAFVGSRPGRTWVSVTGYGRSGERSNWVAFGDDAAAAGGLVAADRDGPVFCGDAIADPVTGLSAATAALASIARGGGHLVDCSMAAASAFANRFGACGAEHRIEGGGTDWYAWHADEARRVEAPRMPVGPSR